MRSDNIIKKYKEAFEQLENYDKTRELDIGRKRIDITLDKKLIKKLKNIAESKHKAVSRIIEDALNIYLKNIGLTKEQIEYIRDDEKPAKKK